MNIPDILCVIIPAAVIIAFFVVTLGGPFLILRSILRAIFKG